MRRLVPIIVTALLLAACGGGGGSGDDAASSPAAKRPSSPAKVSILAPKNGAVVKGSSVEVRMDLEGGKIVDPSVTEVTPTTGHIHVLLDGKVISMDYGLKQKVGDLTAGTHTLRVEFVGSDHLPFNPPVFQEVAFTAKP